MPLPLRGRLFLFLLFFSASRTLSCLIVHPEKASLISGSLEICLARGKNEIEYSFVGLFVMMDITKFHFSFFPFPYDPLFLPSSARSWSLLTT